MPSSPKNKASGRQFFYKPHTERLLMKQNKVSEQVSSDVQSLKHEQVRRLNEKKYKLLLGRISQAEKERDAVKQISEISTFTITPKSPSGQAEATAVVLASDWHYEERVKSQDVNGLNKFDIPIANERIKQFFTATARMIDVFSKDIKIPHLVLALLGDFISNDIHDELVEINQRTPIDAVIEVQNLIASGIEFLLKNYKGDVLVVCHDGNHSRTTKKQRNATESGHSLEFFMYHGIAGHFKGNKRIKFLISASYHSYVKVYDQTIRFHHGHNIKYQGGIGGVFIPAFKAISQWNKGHHADLDCFGHFHQQRDGGNFLLNGSLIGYNAYALSIKAEFEKPKQTFFLVDKRRGKTVTTPICFDI
jgi:predicted phosphodiesterase